MAAKVVSSSFRHEGHVFFIYDHKKKTEEDDPKDAILYFYPRSFGTDDQVALVGGIIGLSDFCSEFMPQAVPRIVKLFQHNFALLQHEDFIIALAASPEILDRFLIAHMQFIWSTFIFYQGSLEAIRERVSANNFVKELNSMWEMYLPLFHIQGDSLSHAFQVLPYVQVNRSESTLFLHASHILQRSLRHQGVLAGAIFNKNKVLCTQLSNNLTRQLLLLMSHSKFPCSEVGSSFELPGGVRLLRVYMPQQEYGKLGYRRHRSYCYTKPTLQKEFEESSQEEIISPSTPDFISANSIILDRTSCRDGQADNKASTKPDAVSPAATLTSGTDSEVFMDTLSETGLDSPRTLKLCDVEQVKCATSSKKSSDVDLPLHQDTTLLHTPSAYNSGVKNVEVQVEDKEEKPPPETPEQIMTQSQKNEEQCRHADADQKQNIKFVDNNIKHSYEIKSSNDECEQINPPSHEIYSLQAQTGKEGTETEREKGNIEVNEDGREEGEKSKTLNDISEQEKNEVRAVSSKDQSPLSNFTSSDSNPENSTTEIPEHDKALTSHPTSSPEHITSSRTSQASDQQVCNDHIKHSDGNKPCDCCGKTKLCRCKCSKDMESPNTKISSFPVIGDQFHSSHSVTNKIEKLTSSPSSTAEKDIHNVKEMIARSKEEIDASFDRRQSGDESSNCSSSELKLNEKEGSNLSLAHGEVGANKDRLTFDSMDSDNSDGGLLSPLSEHGRLSPVAELSVDIRSDASESESDADGTRAKTHSSSKSGTASASGPKIIFKTLELKSSDSGSSSGPKWNPQENGLQEMILYTQGHSDSLLLLLVSHNTKLNSPYINSLWKTSLSHLAELDFQVKDAERHARDDSENIGAAYQYIRYNSFSQSLSEDTMHFPENSTAKLIHGKSNASKDISFGWQNESSVLLPVTSLANEMIDSSIKMHDSFTEMPDLQDITYRSHSACCYGRRTVNTETYFQLGLSRTFAGINPSSDKTFCLDQVAEKVLQNDVKISMI